MEDVLNGTIILSNQSSSPFINEFDSKIVDEVINTVQSMKKKSRGENAGSKHQSAYTFYL